MPTGTHGGAQRVRVSAPDAVGMTAEARAAEERVLPIIGERPTATADAATLHHVATRVLKTVERAAGTIRYLSGPIDILPQDASVGGRLRLAGESGVGRYTGDRIYSGELLMTGKRSLLLVELPGGAGLWLAPSTALLWWRDRDDRLHHRVRLMAGKFLAMAGRHHTRRAASDQTSTDEATGATPSGRESGAAITTRWTLYYPGGEFAAEDCDVQIAVRGVNASTLDVLRGEGLARNARGEKTLGPLDRAVIQAIQPPSIQPQGSRSNPVGWLAGKVKPDDLGEAERARFAALSRTSVSITQERPSIAAIEEEDRRRRRTIIIFGLVVVALLGAGGAIVGKVMGWF
jgi:hypothetical protein